MGPLVESSIPGPIQIQVCTIFVKKKLGEEAGVTVESLQALQREDKF